MRRVVRPFWIIGLTALVTCLVGAWIPGSWLWYVAASSAGCFLFTLLLPRLRGYRVLTVLLAALSVTASVFAYYETLVYQPLMQRVDDKVALRVAVDKTESITELTVLSGDLPRGTRLQLWLEPPDAAIKDRDILEATFVVEAEEASGRSLLLTKASGIWAAVTPVDMSAQSWIISAGEPTIFERLADGREALAERMQAFLANDIGAVVTGVCLGADEQLSDKAVAAFRSCGVSHLFAVSGLHLSILTTAIVKLLKKLRVPRRIRGVISAVAVLGFTFVVGWTPSVTRAGLLCLLVTLGDCLRRQADARNSMGLALTALLIGNPFAAYDAGLLLSFLATFGLLFWSPSIKVWLVRLPLTGVAARLWRYVAETVSVTVAATLATVPVMVLYFGTVSPVSIVANLLLTIPASALLVLGWIAIIALLLQAAVVYQPLLFAVGWIAKLLLWITEQLARLPGASISVASPYLTVWVIGGIVLLFVGYRLLYKRGVAIAAVCVCVALGVGLVLQSARQKDTVRIFTVAAGENLSVCIQQEEGSVLVTAPSSTDFLYATRMALQDKGVTRLEAVFVPWGEARVTDYTSAVLGSYFACDAVYGPREPIEPMNAVHAVWYGEQLHLTVQGVTVAFKKQGNAQADCVFTAEAVTVVHRDELYTITEQNGSFPQLWIKNGELLIK